MSLLGGIVLGAATLLACRKFGARRAGAIAVLLAGGIGTQFAPDLAFAPLAGLLAGLQVERRKGYGQILAAAGVPGVVQGLLFLLAAPGPKEELVEQVVGQLEPIRLKVEEEGYSLRELVEVGLRLQPASEVLFVLFTAVVMYRLSQVAASRLKLSLPPSLEFRRWRPWDHLIWVLIAGLALQLLGSGLVAELGLNTIVVMAILYALQGLAVVRFYCWQWRISRLLEVVLYGVLALTAGLSALVLAALGLLDTWFDWRRLEAAPEQAASGPDGVS